jgi:hypothetical protein
MTDKQLVLKKAQEPTLMTGKRGSEYRTNESWVMLSRVKGGYSVEWGDARGGTGEETFNNIVPAEGKYERWMAPDMEDATKSEIESDNKGLELEDIVRLYINEGDDPIGGVDTIVDMITEEVPKVRGKYKNIIPNYSGEEPWIIATFSRGKEKVDVYFEGWMVKIVRTKFRWVPPHVQVIAK